MNIIDPFTLIFYVIGSTFLLGTFVLLGKAYKDDRRRYTRLNVLFKKIVTEPKNSTLGNFLYNETTEKTLRRLLVPHWIDSITFNGTRLAIVVFATFLLLLKTKTGIGPIPSIVLLIVCLLFSFGSMLKKGLPLYYLLDFNRKLRVRKKNNEVYSLYLLINSEFNTHEEKVGNVYNLLYESRKYFQYIRTSIDQALTSGNGKAINWDAFVSDVNTQEAERLAMIMKEVEVLSIAQTKQLLAQKREEFANHNLREYEDYLEDRGKIIYFVAFICAASIFICPIVVHYLQYRDIMDSVNNINL
jgi:hypothetical protein